MRTTLVSLLFALCCLPLMAQQHNQQQIQKLNYVFNYLRNNYVEDVDLEPLVESAIEATLNQLDPHSSYISRDEMLQMLSSMDGEFTGIGITYAILRDTVVITQIMDASPAKERGLKKNDRIVAVDGRSIVGCSRDTIQNFLRGQRGSNVSLTIARRAQDGYSELSIKRDDIPTKSIGAAYMIGNIAYVDVDSFLGRDVTAEFREVARQFRDAEGVIIDLRGNMGGLLTSAVQFSELFLRRGDRIVSTVGRRQNDVYEASRDGLFSDMPLVILIDEATASASEIVTGALQDHDRAVVVGRRTYGKGLVQRVIKLFDETGIRITIAHYITPSGRDIQRPYSMGDKEGYIEDRERYNHPDSINYGALPRYTTLRNHRTVYGGGGITPDVYVSATQSPSSPFIRTLIEEDIVTEVVVEYFDRNSIDEFMAHYPTLQDYVDGFVLDDDIIEYMVCAVCRHNNDAEEDEEGIAEAVRIVIAQIAEDVYGAGAYHFVYGRYADAALAEAVSIIEDVDAMSRLLGIDVRF